MLLLFTWKSSGTPSFSGSNVNAVAPIGIYGGKDQFTSLSNISAVAPIGFNANNSPGTFWNPNDSISAVGMMGFNANNSPGTFWNPNDSISTVGMMGFAGV